MTDCVFCKIIKAETYEDRFENVVGFPPLNPVVPGHYLVVPVWHAEDALINPELTGKVMRVASMWARDKYLFPCNIMTSVGAEATQSVFHLHIHIVPRSKGDGLMLPWTEQQKLDAEAGQRR